MTADASVVATLPAGIPDAAWTSWLTVVHEGSASRVEELSLPGGRAGGSQQIQGLWRLPTIGLEPLPVGLSADRSTIALVEDGRPGTYDAAQTRFAILRGSLDRPARIVTLPGAFDFDALSPDGSTLYVVEHLPARPVAHYQVRAMETSTGRLKDGVVVDKLGNGEAMAGSAVAQAQRADGMVFTLYRGPDHMFIHALQSAQGWAVCIDLPALAGAADSWAGWDLVPSPDGIHVVAANAALGRVVDVDTAAITIRRTIDFASGSSAPVAGSGTGTSAGPNPVASGHRVAVTSTGSEVFVAGPGGVVSLRYSDLSVGERYLGGSSVTGLALAADAGSLFVLGSDGRIRSVDIATGATVRWPAAGTLDRLVAVLPG